jgi:hypothetical protein
VLAVSSVNKEIFVDVMRNIICIRVLYVRIYKWTHVYVCVYDVDV